MSYFLKYSNDMMKQFHNRGFVLERVEKCLKNFNKYCEEYYPNEKVFQTEFTSDKVFIVLHLRKANYITE